MSKSDGSVIIDTKIDESGFRNGLRSMKNVATKGITAITAAIGAASIAVISLGSEFEAANAKASTLFGDANVDMTKYQDKMLELSNKTGLAASELGNTMYDALSAGIPASDDMAESIGFLEKNTKLAKAGFTDINTATTATAKVLNAYKMDVSQTDRVHKVLMQTQNKGITTVNELGSVLSQVTPTAGAMNVSFEQVGAALANMTAQGTPTAQATTQLNQLFAELGKKGTIGQKSLEAAAKGTEYAGKSFQQLMKEGVPLNKIIDVMSTYADKNKLSMIDMFSSIEAGKSALSVSGKNSEQFTTNLDAMKTSADVVGDAYDKVTDTFKEKSAKVVNSLKNVGIAAYSKFEKPLKGSMDGAQEAVDTLSSQMSSGKLGKSVDTIAEGFSGLIDVVISLVAKAIPLLINGFAFLVDHSKELTIAIAGVSAAMIYYKNQAMITSVINTAMTAGTVLYATIQNVLAKTLTKTEGAQMALNVVMGANPIGKIVLAVGALVAGLTALAFWINDNTAEEDENTIATRKLSEEYDELTESIEENRKNRDETVKSAAIEAQSAEVLATKLDELSKVENKTNAEKEQMKYYVDELNKIMPDLKLNYDEEKDALNKSTTAIYANIEAQKALAIAKAYEENMSSTAKDIANNQLKLNKAEKQRIKNQTAYNEAVAKEERLKKAAMEAGSEASSERNAAWVKASEEAGKAKENLEETTATVEKYKNRIEDLNVEFNEHSNAAKKAFDSAEIEKELGKIAEACRKKSIVIPEAVSKGIRDGSYAVPKSVDEMKTLINLNSLIEDAKKKGIEIPKSISDGIADGSLKPADAVKQMKNLVTFDDIEEKAKKAGVSIPEAIKTKILEGSTKPKEATNQMQRLISFTKTVTDAGLAGEEVPEIIKQKIMEGSLKPKEAIEQMQRLVNFNTLLSMSGLAGKDVPEYIENGILEGKLTPAQAIEEMNKSMVKAAAKSEPGMKLAGENNAKKEAEGARGQRGLFENAGYFLAKGLEIGSTTQSALGSLWDAGVAMAKAVMEGTTSKEGLDVRSPSRKGAEIGAFYTKGIVNGAVKEGKSLVSAGINLGKTLVNSAKNSKSYNFESVGKNLISTFTRGMESNESKAVSSVSKVINSTVSTLAKKNPKAKSEYEKAGKALINSYSSAVQKETDKLTKSVSNALDKASKEAQSKYEELVRKRESLFNVMNNSDDLLTTKGKKKSLTDLTKNKKEIDDYGKNLNALKSKIPADLMEEILGMSFEEGKAYTDQLLGLDKKSFDAYVKSWKDRQKSIKSISDSFYASQIKGVKTTFDSSVKKIFSNYEKDMKNIGVNVVKGVVSGMTSQSKSLKGASKSLADSILKEFKKVLKIKSPSRAMEEAAEFVPDGAAKGIDKNAKKPIESTAKMAKGITDAFKVMDIAKYITPLKQAVYAQHAQLANAMEASASIEINKMTGSSDAGSSETNYNTEVVINSAKALKPSEIGTEVNNTMRRLAWAKK